MAQSPQSPIQPEAVVTSEAPVSRLTGGEVAQPYEELAGALDKAGQGLEALAEPLAQRAGVQAVTRNPATGELQVAPPPPIFGQAGETYTRAVKVGALAEADGDFKRKDIELAQEYRNNPEGYAAAAQAYKQTKVADLTAVAGPEVGVAVGRAIDSTTTYTYRGLINEQHRLGLERAENNIKDGIASASDDALALARQGVSLDDPALQQAIGKYASLLDERTRNPEFAYTPAQRDFDLAQFQGELAGQRDLYHVDQVYKTQGYQAAMTAAQDILSNPAYKLSDAQRYRFYGQAASEIRANEGMRRESISQAGTALMQLNMLPAGTEVPADQWKSVADQYTAAGDAAGAARVWATYTQKYQSQSFVKQPLADQIAQVKTLQGAAATATSPAEMRLIQHESGGNPSIVNKFGYAGLYQFGAPLLSDLGLYKPGAGENVHDPQATGGWSGQKWTGTFSIPGFPEVKTLRDFLGNTAAQKAAFDAHTANMDTQIGDMGLDKYIGQNVGGVPITREGLHAMIHLGGAEGARVALQTGGAVNPRDANGTSLLDYARMGGQANVPNPGTAAWLLANRQYTLDGELWNSWRSTMQDYREKGVVPNIATMTTIIDGAKATGNTMLLRQISTDMAGVQVVKNEQRVSLPQQNTDIAQLNAAAGAGQLPPGLDAVPKALENERKNLTTGLEKNPIATTAAVFSDRFDVPAPLDLGDPDKLQAGLAQRAKIAQFARQNWQTGPVSALDDADLKQVQGALAGAQPQQKAAIFAGLSTLPPDVLGATLKKLGGDSPVTMAEAAAGSMVRSAPDIASSIFRGMAAIEGTQGEPKPGPTTKVLDPSAQSKANFSTDFAKVLPSATFTPADRADPTGPYATMQMMVRARYADLAAKAGDNEYSAARVAQAVTDVTGGVLYQNGSPLIAPARGMTQGRFDAVMGGITDRDLQGVTDANGRPITADYLRQSRLQSVGDGRYWVNLGNKGDLPVYAYVGANSEAPSRFVLDLRGRQPAPNMPDTQFMPQTVQP